MNWMLLLALTAIVFLNRYIFLEPLISVRIPMLLKEALKYSPSCLLTAICGPIILMEDGMLRSFPDNPYLWGGLCAIIISALVRKMFLSVLLSLLLFYTIVFLLG